MSLLTERKLKRNDVILKVIESSGLDFDHYICKTEVMRKMLSEKYPLINKDAFIEFVFNEVNKYLDRGVTFVVGAGSALGKKRDTVDYCDKISRQIIYMLCVSIIDSKPMANPIFMLKSCDLNTVMREIFDFNHSNDFIDDVVKYEILYIPNFNSKIINHFTRSRDVDSNGVNKTDIQREERIGIYFDDMLKRRNNAKKITIIGLSDEYDNILRVSKTLGLMLNGMFVHLHKRANKFDFEDVCESRGCRLYLASREKDAVNAGISTDVVGSDVFSDTMKNVCFDFCSESNRLENLIALIEKSCKEIGVDDGLSFLTLSEIISDLNSLDGKRHLVTNLVESLEKNPMLIVFFLSRIID